MRARLRSWWQNTSKTLDVVVILMLVVLIALVVVIVLGYTNNWSWAGLRGKTLYDWLQLLIIPVVLAVGGYLFNYTTGRTEREIASDRQREEALQAYIDKMSELLLHEHLGESPPPQVQVISRARTVTVLRILDPIRRGSLIRFLSQADILRMCIENELEEIDLHGADLTQVNLSNINLRKAVFKGANLYEANLREAYLREADLEAALLETANLEGANLEGANLEGANLEMANLFGANLRGANLRGAFLRDAMIEDDEVWIEVHSLKGATMPDGTKHA